MNDDTLSALLDDSAPPASEVTPAVANELVRLRASTGSGRAPVRARRWARPALAGAAALALLAGAGTAAAASGTWVLPWAESNALASIAYTPPSGLQCELRIGGVTSSVPAVISTVETFYRTTDFDALLTDAAIRAKVAEREAARGGDAPGTYNPDSDYETAIIDIVFTAMDDDLARHGLAFVDKDWTLQAEPMCPGAEG